MDTSTVDYIMLYLVTGLIVLFILDCTTGRIRRNLKNAAYDTQDILAKAGMPLSLKITLPIIAVALWAFWPVAIYGAIESLVKDKTRSGDNDKNT